MYLTALRDLFRVPSGGFLPEDDAATGADCLVDLLKKRGFQARWKNDSSARAIALSVTAGRQEKTFFLNIFNSSEPVRFSEKFKCCVLLKPRESRQLLTMIVCDTTHKFLLTTEKDAEKVARFLEKNMRLDNPLPNLPSFAP